MDGKNLFLLALIILVMFSGFYYAKKQKKPQFTQPETNIIVPPIINPPIPEKKPPQKIEPVWTIYEPVKPVEQNLGIVLGDIESHLPKGHIYRDNDKITHAHESSHGIHSHIRNKYSQSMGKINAFYCLENKAAIIQEPPVTIRQVAAIVPSSLKGGVYNLYLVQQAGSWNNTPLYLLDEHDAYINGSAARKDLKIQDRAETVTFMFEFNIYAMCLTKIVKEKAPNYDDKQLKAYLMWSFTRTVEIYNGEPEAKKYWLKFKNNADAKELRKFCENYFGKEWCDNLSENILNK